jgi:hypothetical protein
MRKFPQLVPNITYKSLSNEKINFAYFLSTINNSGDRGFGRFWTRRLGVLAAGM